MLKVLALFSISFWLSACHAQKSSPDRTDKDSVVLGNNIMTIFQDSKHNYWFGSWETGLYVYNGKEVRHYTTADGLPSNRVETIHEYHDGSILLSTTGGIATFDGQKFTILNDIVQDGEWKLQPQDLWIKDPGYSGALMRYDGQQLHRLLLPKSDMAEEWVERTKVPHSPYAVYTIYKDTKGNVWVGTAAAGAMRYNGTSFDWITEDDVNEFHFGPSNGVRSVIEDKNGHFWFNSAYRYIIRDVRAPGQSFYVREKSIGSLDGIDENFTEYLSIARDDHNDLWFVTYLDGIYRYDGNKVTHFPVKENGKNIKAFFIYKDQKGDLWVGTHENGVYKFNGTSFEKWDVH